MDASHAELITEQEIWAVIDACQNKQAFHYANGNVYKWKFHQRILAQKIDLEPLPYEGEGFSLDEAKKDKGLVQDAIFNERKLLD